MPDIIKLLSDHIANQIAAGEVISRPASAVKELLENAVDAGATSIALILKDAGKDLIQVIDNGKGMSATDARMCFERHATSKISQIDDLFKIQTMGFRGEALASMAAIAHIEMCTATAEGIGGQPGLGTRIIIEGTQVKLQEPCQQPQGTNIMLKNLFYNVPARRNFLKSNTVEYRYIHDEFVRVALAHPNIRFSLQHNNVESYNLYPSNAMQRITAIIGSGSEKKLMPIQETNDFFSVSGCIGKPEAATKTRTGQYFFINKRYIRNLHLHHAVVNAFESLIPKDSHPVYVLFITIDPAKVDINVHPTKQDVKFDDDRMMYAYLHAAIKHAIGRYNLSPSIDFDLDPQIASLSAVQQPFTAARQAEVASQSYLSNVFREKGQAHAIERGNSLKHWQEVYSIANAQQSPSEPISYPESLPQATPTIPSLAQQYEPDKGLYAKQNAAENTLSIHDSVLAAPVKSGLMLIHIRRAQERIWYEHLAMQVKHNAPASQQLLFPVVYHTSVPD
ncbi:MAG: DNA mismatch repair endonuclease MutL, partial [Chitinophagia bacterium]|nr:DNA mismatch repair endonuclease MutL [Chitinophagia bacterium]